ncbi:haloacid dehalogenase-like hydrolase [Streptococcus iniae]|uniref:DUF7916 family protein n=1 Tax=Streptococcus iniae TaxID=1346 RepID=UPI0008DA97CD|nr:PEP phosphonomutase [Streptococcus iniae]OHX27405.1 PEP phosphonomutase [Streptococcus iniae]RLV28155.1 haloacid dehalogenase-like hydrolase [Streptococcus iniae]
MKRLISANPSEILAMTPKEFKQSIKASEGRVLVSENVVIRESFAGDLTNAEIARAYGADMILLNLLDVFNPYVFGLETSEKTIVQDLHHLIGSPVGVNLEPVDFSAEMLEDLQGIAKGRLASRESFEQIERQGFDFVCLTGNPGTGVSNHEIIKAIKLAKECYSGLIIAGKMHGSGVNEAVIDSSTAQQFLEAGADVLLVPAVGTVPGFTETDLHAVVKCVHSKGGLVMSAIGTSQETADTDTIKQMAIRNKICGVDMQHIGDAGYGGLAIVDNIYAMSNAIRGLRHTVSRMARSVNR